jgi:hypothetical protein
MSDAVDAVQNEWHAGNVLGLSSEAEAVAMTLLLLCAPDGAAVRVTMRDIAGGEDVASAVWSKVRGEWVGAVGRVPADIIVDWMRADDFISNLPHERVVTVEREGGES